MAKEKEEKTMQPESITEIVVATPGEEVAPSVEGETSPEPAPAEPSEEAVPAEQGAADMEFMRAFVKEKFGLKMLKASRPLETRISRVAMCGGSGGSLIGAARKSGAQLYISGDISYHNFFTDEGFMIMDIGHYESEIEIVSILFSLIKKNFPTFAVRITQNINSNPIYYF